MRTKSLSRRSFLSASLLAGSAGVLSPVLARADRLGQAPTPVLEDWLNAHPNVRDAIVWYYPNANSSIPEKRTYAAWTSTDKKSLQQMFDAAWKGYTVQLDDPPVNLSPANQYPATVLKPIDAFEYYLNSVGHSLAVELGKRVPWSIQHYSAEELAILLDGSWTFAYDTSLQGMRIRAGNNGYYTPSPPQLIWNFLKGIGVLAAANTPTPVRRVGPPPSQSPVPFPPETSAARRAVASLFDWCRSNLHHANESGDPTTEQMQAIWQYTGFPPLSRIINGTTNLLMTSKNNPPNHWTAGCIGTTGFLSGVLRSINIPVKHVLSCKHSQPVFPTLKAALSHGDDLYDRFVTAGGANPNLPFPSDEIFIAQVQFDGWFGAGAASPCSNIGRRPAELARKYLPYAVMLAYCQDKKLKTPKANSKVYGMFQPFYSIAELDASDLWGRLEQKSAAGFACGG